MPDDPSTNATRTPDGPGPTITGTITGNSGQAAIGTNNTQTQTITRVDLAKVLTPEELQQLTDAFAGLKAKVATEAPHEVRDEAVRQAEVLETATKSEQPNVSAMSAAKNWFLRNAPGLLGAVTSVVINPIVGKIVHAAGEAVAKEYEKWFPEAQSS